MVRTAGTLTLVLALAAATLLVPLVPALPPAPQPAATERAVFVGNNWDGTADILRFDPATGFERIVRLNVIPDIEARLLEIAQDPVRLAYFLAIRMAVGEGHDQYVDDMYSTPDGTRLIVSRPSLRDVVGIDLATGAIAWRFVVDGQRSDHMAMTPDGTRVAVSASTGNVVHILDVATGLEVGRFGTGDSPHENQYSRDGSRIFHASIGLVYTPLDQPVFDATKGNRTFQVVDAATNTVLKRVNMGQKLAEAGLTGESSAVRPMALSPDERYLYFQWSFYHGFAEYDLEQDKVLRVAPLPDLSRLLPPESPVNLPIPRELYLLDSAHHGIAMDAAGTKLCVSGTMSDYAAIVDRADFSYTLLQEVPEARSYWSTTSDDGAHCFVSWAGLDKVSAISYASEQEVAEITVGDHPQRVRTGAVRTDLAAAGR